jgi:hypothetical protein
MAEPAAFQQQLAALHAGQPEQQQQQEQLSNVAASSNMNSTSVAATAADTAAAGAAIEPAADAELSARVLQLLPGLSPAAIPAVAARMLDGAAVTMGRRLGCGAFATVYEAQLAGSRAKWVVKRLDRVAPEHVQQVR